MSSTIKSTMASTTGKGKKELSDTNDRFQTCSLRVSKNLLLTVTELS